MSPVLSTCSNASARGYGLFSSLGDGYFAALLYSSSFKNAGTRIAVDSAGNIYTLAFPQGTGDASLVKMSGSGTVLWQRKVGSLWGNGYYSNNGLTLDSSGNAYIAGSDVSNTNVWLAKYNSSGVIQWQKYFKGSSGYSGVNNIFYANNAIWICGWNNYYSYSYGKNDAWAKFDLNGAVLAQYYMPDNGGEWYDIYVDSSGNQYLAGYYNSGSSTTLPHFAKVDSSGAKQFGKEAYLSGVTYSNYQRFLSVLPDSSSNIYYSGYFNYASLIKLNSTASTVLWAKQIQSSTSPFFDGKIVEDSNGNVYVAFRYYIYKFDSSGTIQWQRYVYLGGGGYASDVNTYMKIVGTKLFIIQQTSTYETVIVTMPTDGSKLGSFPLGSGTLTIAASSTTINNISNFYSSNFNPSIGNTNYTVSSASLTDSANSLTQIKTAI